MKVKLVNSKSEDRWYAEAGENLLGATFQVIFSEIASKDLQRNVYEILSGKHKGKFIDVRDTQIVIKKD